MDHRKMLRITGCDYPERLDAIFSSYLVDVAYIDQLTDDGALIIADDPNWPSDTRDFKWLCSVIEKTLAKRGIIGIGFVLLPQAAS